VNYLNILVVDDELGMRLGIARSLRDYKIPLPEVETEVAFNVDLAETGEHALEKINANPPDILLLDHKLPGISGLDVLDHLHEPKDRMLTIMITAYASLETAVAAIKNGAYDFLAKPFTPGELKAVIKKAAQGIILAQQARKLAQEKRQVRFQFISVLAHELKAPLAALEGYLDIVQKRSAGDDPAVYNHILDRCSIRLTGMRKMIMDLLDLTHIESGQKQRELSQIDLRDVAQTALETVAPAAQQRHITVNLHADQPVNLLADRGEIEIILNNLLSNAVKYNRDNGSVDLSLTNDQQHVRITVADTGIGMTDEQAARLFNDFVRIKTPQTRNILGSGLGLAIVKKIAYLYQGDVAVTSSPDKGSTFTVTLAKSEKS